MLLGGLETQEANHLDFVFAKKGRTEWTFLETDLVTKAKDWNRYLKTGMQHQQLKDNIQLGGVLGCKSF